MSKLLKNNLTLADIDQGFSTDLQEMYSSPDLVSADKKSEIKSIALSLADNFKTTIIDFYFANGGFDMNDDNFDILYSNFEKFTAALLTKLNSLRADKVVYSSVAIMWTGMFTQLEKESKILNDVGLVMTTQNFLIKLLDGQNAYYKSIKK